MVGSILFFIQCSTLGECPQFESVASVGGVVWCLSNVLLVPIVSTVGVGICMTVWGTSEMFAGWATARFGLMGLAAQPVSSDFLNFGGVSLGLLSLIVLSQATSTVSEVENAAPLLEQYEDESGVNVVMSIQGSEHAIPESGYDFYSNFTPLGKKVFGISSALVAGTLSGSMFTPVQYIVDHPHSFPGSPRTLLGNLYAHYTGILFTSIPIFALYCFVTGNRPWVNSSLTLPALAAGVCWGLAGIFWFFANETLSIVIAFPLVTLSPGLISMVIGGVFYGEVVGTRNIVLISGAAILFSAAAICISLSGGAAG